MTRRALGILAAICCLSLSPASADELYPAGINANAIMQGVYESSGPGDCCWLAQHAAFTVAEPAGADTLVLFFTIPPFALRHGAPAKLSVTVGGGPAHTLCCFGAGSNVAALPVARSPGARDVLIEVSASNPFVPKAIGLNADPRTLTILLQRVQFQSGAGVAGDAGDTVAPSVQSHRSLALAFAALLGIVVLVLTLLRARYAWLALLVCAPFALAVYVGPTTVTLQKAVLVGAALGLLCKPARLRALRGSGVWYVGGTLVLLIACAALSSLHAAHLSAALRGVLMWVEYLAAFAIAVIAYRCDPQEHWLRNVLAGMTVVVACTALAQVFTGAPQAKFLFGHAIARVGGVLEGPNQLAGYLGVMLAVPLAFAVYRRSTVLERVALAFGGVALLLTFSRGGWLGAVAVLVVLLAVRAARERAFAAMCACAAAWVLLLAGTLAVALVWYAHGGHAVVQAVQYNGGLGSRNQLWPAAITLWLQHPLLGVGPGNFELLVGALLPGVRTHANGQFLQALAEGGVLGFALLLALVAATLHVLARGRTTLAVAIYAMAIGFWVHELVDTLLLYPKVGLAYWALVGIAIAAATLPAEPKDSAEVI